MAIYLKIQQQAQCEMCSGQWAIERNEIFEICPYCKSPDWVYGVEPRDLRFIRQQITRKAKRLNPGAKARNRQVRAKALGQGFQPKKKEDDDARND